MTYKIAVDSYCKYPPHPSQITEISNQRYVYISYNQYTDSGIKRIPAMLLFSQYCIPRLSMNDKYSTNEILQITIEIQRRSI